MDLTKLNDTTLAHFCQLVSCRDGYYFDGLFEEVRKRGYTLDDMEQIYKYDMDGTTE